LPVWRFAQSLRPSNWTSLTLAQAKKYIDDVAAGRNPSSTSSSSSSPTPSFTERREPNLSGRGRERGGRQRGGRSGTHSNKPSISEEVCRAFGEGWCKWLNQCHRKHICSDSSCAKSTPCVKHKAFYEGVAAKERSGPAKNSH
jgi:hypothetical protein